MKFFFLANNVLNQMEPTSKFSILPNYIYLWVGADFDLAFVEKACWHVV